MKPLQAIIFFDLDNTLVKIENSHNFFDNIIVEVFDEYHIKPPTIEQRNQLWRNSDYKKLLRSWNFQDPVLFWKTFDRFDLNHRKALYNQGNLKIFDDVIPTLEKLRNFKDIRLVLITNSSLDITNFELDSYGLRKFFHEILALGDTQDDCKPNPKRLLQLLDSLSGEYKFSKDKVFIIGDSPFDISAGKNANIKSILMKRWDKSHKLWTDLPDYTIDNMEHIFSILLLE
ncbi:MAG: HAD family hydrolase [Promethearchaeota archaeon]